MSLVLVVVASAGANAKGPPVAVFDGIVESQSGGFMFPDGTVLDSAAGSYANIVVVAASGGHFTSIQAALDSISAATSSNRYLVKIAPGTYSEQVTMKPFVDIEGSGQLVTKITFPGFAFANQGTVVGADDAELRSLTVENTGTADYAIAILTSMVSPRLTGVTASASGGSVSSIAIRNAGGAPELNGVRAVAALGVNCRGLQDVGGAAKLKGVDVRAILCSDHNIAINASAAASITLTDVTALGSGGDNAMGIFAYQASVRGRDVRITAQGATTSIAVQSWGSSITVDEGELRADGPTATTLVSYSQGGVSSSAEFSGVELIADANAGGVGLAVESIGATIRIRGSRLAASGGSGTWALLAFGGSTVRVAHSQLVGGAFVPPSEIVCLGAYSGSLVALNSDCL